MIDEILAVGSNPEATERDIAQLLKKVVAQDKAANPRLTVAALGPIGGLMDGAYRLNAWYEYVPFWKLIVNRLTVWWILYYGGVKKRAGYNDFLIVRWALNQDEATAAEMLERAKREDSIGVTMCFALRSLSRNYIEFDKRFCGKVPPVNPRHMLNDAPPNAIPSEVIRRTVERMGSEMDPPTATQ